MSIHIQPDGKIVHTSGLTAKSKAESGHRSHNSREQKMTDRKDEIRELEGQKEKLLNQHQRDLDPASTAQVSQRSIEIESDRYELWANNIAALQDAYLPTSLEYRIREDASARNAVEKALAYLKESLKLALEIISGQRPNETWEETAPANDNAGDTTTKSSSEIVELYLSIKEAISNLFRLSMIIRKKPERDEYAKAAKRYQIDPTSDIVHVGDKYPTARRVESPWLVKRLGISITQRRQYLLYRREHQQRMQEAHKLKADPDGNTVWSGTKASTYLPDENAAIDPQEHVVPLKIMLEPFQKRPQTEYADSSRGKDGATDFLRTPPLPMRQDGNRVNYGEHFECPYCWRVQNVENKYEWKKHVLGDLKPYVCTFQLCELNLFESQHDWFTHELRFHRKQWCCSICKERQSESRPDLITHLVTDHQKELGGGDAEIFVETCQIERIDATECPLCTEYGEKLQKVNESSKCDVSLKQFQQHLGIHMQQLALAALPYDHTEEADDEADDNSDIRTVESESRLDTIEVDLYKILGVERDATQQAIENATVQKLDPSLHFKSESESSPILQQQYDIARAYRILREPEMRSQYDLRIIYRSLHPAFKNPYNILRVDDNVSVDIVSNLFHLEIIKYEQGRERGDSDATLRYCEAQWAYVQLSDPKLRAICDKTIASQNSSSATIIPSTKQYNIDGTEFKGKAVADDSVTTITIEKGGQSDAPISFVDAVGRRFSFPFDLCKTIEGMEGLIQQAFLHVDNITTHIHARRYDLLDSDGRAIERKQWDTTISPGSSITMQLWPLAKLSENEARAALAKKAEEMGWVCPPESPDPNWLLQLPDWIRTIVSQLKLEYPRDIFDGIMLRRSVDIYTQTVSQAVYLLEDSPSHIVPIFIPCFKCLDCFGRGFDLGPGRTANLFRAHLQSATHRQNVQEELDERMIRPLQSGGWID